MVTNGSIRLVQTTLLSGLIFLGLSACTGSSDSTTDEGGDSAMYIPITDLSSVSQLKSRTGISWLVSQTPMLDSSLVNVMVQAKGIPGDTLSVDFGEVDPVLEVRLDDLDHDGFQELYVITQSVGPEAFGTIFGMYSSRDTSLTVISYEGATPYQMKEGEPYVGYRGHDRFRFDQGELTNTFPVYKPDDEDDQPTGGESTVVYELVRGQASLLLRPKSRD